MTQVRIFFILMMLVISTLSVAGCGDCPVSTSTMLISKVSHDGIYQWTKILDTGIDNDIKAAIPGDDGGIVTAGYVSTKKGYCAELTRPRIIRFSASGDIVWDRIYEEEGKATTISSLSDGGYIAVFNTGKVVKIDREGKILWENNVGHSSEFWAVTEDKERSIVIAGRVFAKLDKSGTIVWERTYPESNVSEVKSVKILKEDDGFLMLSDIPGNYHTYSMVISQLDVQGNFLNSTAILVNTSYFHGTMVEKPDGYEIYYLDTLYHTVNQTGLIHLDSQGNLVRKTSIDIPFTLASLKNGDYIFTELVDQNVHIVKLNQNQTREWNTVLPDKGQFGLTSDRIIETSDGGFITIFWKPGELVDLSK